MTTSLGHIQRCRRVFMTWSVAHKNDPAAPPVDRTYLMPACVKSGTLTEARSAPLMPPQFSAPHSPVANQSDTVAFPPWVMSVANGARSPPTFVEIVFVFQFMLMLVSL